MPQITRRRLRLACDLLSFAGPVDKRTGQTPKLWLSNDYAIELAFFNGAPSAARLVADFANLASITLEIKALVDGVAPPPAAAPLASATITDYVAIAFADWETDTDQSATVELSAVEMSLAPGAVWLVISAATLGGQVVTLLAGKVELVEDGYNSAGTAPVLTNAAWTKAEADARYLRSTSSPTTGRRELAVSDDLVLAIDPEDDLGDGPIGDEAAAANALPYQYLRPAADIAVFLPNAANPDEVYVFGHWGTAYTVEVYRAGQTPGVDAPLDWLVPGTYAGVVWDRAEALWRRHS